METIWIERRLALHRLGWLVLAPVVALSLPAGHARARTDVAVPQGSWVLTRVLERGLSDGKAVVVTRKWAIRFAATATGMRVDGKQIFADVQAPEKLAPLAKIERERKVTDMFPAELDARGRIVRMPVETSNRTIRQTIQAALQILHQEGESEAAIADKRRFMLKLEHTAADQVSRVPIDLFFPATGHDEEQRDMTLPDGETGHIAIAMTARMQAGSGLLEHSERRVTTSIGGRQSRSSESWSLAPQK